jgi:hypothetical protein
MITLNQPAAKQTRTVDTSKVARGHAWVSQLSRGGRHLSKKAYNRRAGKAVSVFEK